MSIPKTHSSSELTAEKLARTAEMLRVLAHPHRLRLIELLEQQRAGMPVNELSARMGLAPAATSQHLNHMRRAGVLAALRQGREVWYRIADPRSLTILHCMRGRK